jgi:hypothetical protein
MKIKKDNEDPNTVHHPHHFIFTPVSSATQLIL